MPPLTFELIGVIITGILMPLFGAAFWLWKQILGKIAESQKISADRIDSMASERARLLQETRNEEKELADRIKSLEQNSVTKDDHNKSLEAMNRALEGMSLALRETGATLTSRIDLVLFEVGKRNAKP